MSLTHKKNLEWLNANNFDITGKNLPVLSMLYIGELNNFFPISKKSANLKVSEYIIFYL